MPEDLDLAYIYHIDQRFELRNTIGVAGSSPQN
jgi:hypothetical protein